MSTPQRYARVLACALCQHRKIKCDRNEPCSNCVKADVPCTPSTPAPARKRRRPNQDLRERLARCEELLLQYSGPDQAAAMRTSEGAFPLTPVTNGGHQPEAPVSQPTGNDLRPSCILVHGDDGPRLVDSYLWASLYGELQSMREIVETEDTGDIHVLASEETVPDSSVDLLLSGDDPSTNVADLQPDPAHAFRLWQLFLDRVNPLTKIIHAPTVQPYVMEAAANISSIPVRHQALLFSIYTMAIVSLSDHECLKLFNMSRDIALHKYTLGAKLSLIRFNFLKNYNMVTLQALILFLCSLEGRYDRYASWIISGIIMRIAQKMGYHRDGEVLNLSPFETEMRRRIWWGIVVQDSNHAMASDLTPSLLPNNSDTKEPQNLNDADLFPNATEPVRPREGPTEMAFCIILHRLYKLTIDAQKDPNGELALGAAMLGQNHHGKSTVNGIQSNLTDSGSHNLMMDRILQDLEKKYVDPKAGNTHIAALSIRPMLMKKVTQMLIPIQEQPEWGTEILNPEDNIFKVLIVAHEYGCEAYERMLAVRFEWCMKSLFQLETFAALTGQLCQRPTGLLSDRGWKVVELLHKQHSELFDMTQKPYIVQAQYTLKAWKARETAISQAGQIVERPTFITQLQETMLTLDSQSTRKSSFDTSLALVQPDSQQMTELEDFLGGYNPSDLTWGTWGDPLNDR